MIPRRPNRHATELSQNPEHLAGRHDCHLRDEPWDEIREKIFESYALKSMEDDYAKLRIVLNGWSLLIGSAGDIDPSGAVRDGEAVTWLFDARGVAFRIFPWRVARIGWSPLGCCQARGADPVIAGTWSHCDHDVSWSGGSRRRGRSS